MRTRPRYITLIEAEVGMTLAAPVSAVHQGALQLTFPMGHPLSSDNLRQLRAHHVEFIFVTEPDIRTSEQIAIDVARAAHRVLETFATADLSNPTMMALFDQVMTYRSA